MVLTTPMVLTQTHGIVLLVLLNHTPTRGLSVALMRDHFTWSESSNNSLTLLTRILLFYQCGLCKYTSDMECLVAVGGVDISSVQ